MTVGMGGMDPGALQRQALEQIGREAGSAGPAGTAGASDVERFNAALRPAGESGLPGIAPPDAPPPPDAAAPLGAGDRILAGLASVSGKIQAGRSEAVGVMAKSDVTQADLLKANFAMLETGTLVSAVAKTTEKITQGVKTLQQG